MAKSKIEYIPLEKIKRWERNPKDHDLGALHQSIDRFGFVAPLIVDEKNGKLVAGHGRLDALQQMKASGAKPPKGIVVEKDAWLVPVRAYPFKNEQEREAYSLADNRLVELGGYDQEQLAQVLSDLAADGEEFLIGTGYDGNDIDTLLKALNPNEENKFGNENIEELYRIVIECKSEKEQVELLERLTNEGLSCRALIS